MENNRTSTESITRIKDLRIDGDEDDDDDDEEEMEEEAWWQRADDGRAAMPKVPLRAGRKIADIRDWPVQRNRSLTDR